MTNKSVIAVCIATYKRPELLENCLNSIAKIDIPENYKIVIIVVDNDKNKSAEAAFIKTRDNTDIESHYYIEPDRGICSARNRLLEKSLDHDANYIAFIDDDELAHKSWLINMIEALNAYACEIIAGPVIPIYETTPPESFNEDNKHLTGKPPRNIPAGNVFFNITIVNKLGLRFDRYFDFIGCEDFDFFERAIRNNMKSVWVNNAVVFETITEDRRTRRYTIYRHFTGGINVVLRYRRHHSLISAWGRYLPKAIGKFIGSAFSLIAAIFVSHQTNFEKFLIKLSNGCGYLCGLTNIIVERYRYQ